MMSLHRDAEPVQAALLLHRAKVIIGTLAAFTVGAIAGGLAETCRLCLTIGADCGIAGTAATGT
jgi:hypothetical protein